MECFDQEDIFEAFKQLPWLIFSALCSFVLFPIRLPFIILRTIKQRTINRAKREFRHIHHNIQTAVTDFVGQKARKFALVVAISAAYTLLLVYVVMLSFPGMFCLFAVVLMSAAKVATNFDAIFFNLERRRRGIQNLDHGFN